MKSTKFVVLALVFSLMALISGVVYAAYINPEYIDNTEMIAEQNQIINDAYERKNLAHEFAENARYFGYAEDSDIIKHAQQEWNEADAAMKAAESKLEEANLIDLHYIPNEPVGLSVAGFDKMLEGTSLAGQGQALYDLEQTYGINGVFCLGVANTESTLGKHCYGYNPFGMLSGPGQLIRYGSWYDAIMAFGKLMNRDMYYGKDIDGIAKIYCPPTSSNWANTVKTSMSMLYSKLEA